MAILDWDGDRSHLSADSQPKSVSLVWVGGDPALSLHSSSELGELLQWLWSWWQHNKHCHLYYYYIFIL